MYQIDQNYNLTYNKKTTVRNIGFVMFIKKKYKSKISSLLILLIALSLTACISRLSRPEMTGQIIDEMNQPIPNVSVGESKTDKNGFFTLKEHRYNAFLLTEILVMEAPAVFVQEVVEKSGYQTCFLEYYNSYGGGQAKGAKWEVGQVVLKLEHSNNLKKAEAVTIDQTSADAQNQYHGIIETEQEVKDCHIKEQI